MDDAENLNPKKHLEDGEFIETLLVPLDSLLESINSTYSIMSINFGDPQRRDADHCHAR